MRDGLYSSLSVCPNGLRCNIVRIRTPGNTFNESILVLIGQLLKSPPLRLRKQECGKDTRQHEQREYLETGSKYLGDVYEKKEK
jgi:hypothetical protein